MKRLFVLLVSIAVTVSCFGIDNSQVTMHVNFSNGTEVIDGNIVIQLYDDLAPVTTENFLDYIRADFYNGLIFHRVTTSAEYGLDIIQTGGYYPDLTKKDPIFPNIINENSTGLNNTRGSIAMARQPGDMNSANSQFYINYEYNSSLDGDYSVFGMIIEGMDIVDQIGALPVRNEISPTDGNMPHVPIYDVNIVDVTITRGCLGYPDGDIDGDCDVDFTDFTLLANAFGTLPEMSADHDWDASYDANAGGLVDWAQAITIDSDDNVCVTGRSVTNGSAYDYLTVKYSADGNEMWSQIYDGIGSDTDCANAIVHDSNNDIYVTGYSRTAGNDYDCVTVKYSGIDGSEIWVQRYDGQAGAYDSAYAIAVDSADNIFVTGSAEGMETLHNYITIKYSSDGTVLWSAVYNGPADGTDKATSIAIDASGDVYVTGRSEGVSSGYDYATIKYDGTDGTEIWLTRYNRSDKADWGQAIALDDSNNVYVTGHSVDSGNPDEDYATVKYDTDGVQLWAARYNGPDNDSDKACAIASDPSGNVYVTGKSYAIGADFDYVTVKYDTNGTELWVKRYDGGGGDYPKAIALDSQANAYVTGESYHDTDGYNYLTIRYDANGLDPWGHVYNGTANGNDTANAIAIDSHDDVYVTGASSQTDTGIDYVTVKYDQFCLTADMYEDINNDCVIDMKDLDLLAESWLEDNYI